MAVLLDSPLQTDRALALLSELSPAERTDEGHLLWALARSLRPPYATNRERDVVALESIANGRGPWALHARFYVALFRAERAYAELGAAYDGEHPETILPHRQKLDTLKSACDTLVSTAGELGPDRAEHLKEVIVRCQEILHWFVSAFEVGTSMQR
jgi:hypothetical protein